MPSFGQVLWRLQRNEPVEAASDAELVHQFLRDRSASAFEAIVRRHGPLVLRVCQRELPIQADAEDAFQATFLLLAQKARTIRQESSLAAWLAGVARRLSRRLAQQLRQRRKRLTHLHQVPKTVASHESPSWWEDERRLLPQEYQTVIDLCLIQGLTRDEAAEQLGQSPAAVHGMLYRARIKLKKQLLKRGTVAGPTLVGAQATVSAIDRLAPAIAQSAVKLLEKGTLTSGIVAPSVIALMQSKSLSTSLLATLIAGGLLLGGMGWWGLHAMPKNSGPTNIAANLATVPANGEGNTSTINDAPLPVQPQQPTSLWNDAAKWLQQLQDRQQQQASQQVINPPDEKVQQALQSGVPLPQFPNITEAQKGGKGAPYVPPVIPVPPADRVPTGSERLNLAKGMLSSSGSLHEGMVPLLPNQSKHAFENKTLLLSLITSEKELEDCTAKAPPIGQIPLNVQVMNDTWQTGAFQVDWTKDVLIVALVLERANSVTLTPVDKCWIAPDAKGVGHLLLNYSGMEPEQTPGEVPNYRKQYPYVMLKVPRKDLAQVAVTVWRTGAKPDGVAAIPTAGK